MSTRRKGKIAQLPYETRNRVNLALRDGLTYSAVVSMLEQLGHQGITEKNVENWAKPDESGSCGYQDWLKEQDRLADIESKRNFALEIVRANAGNDIHEAGLQLMAAHLYEVATDFDVNALKSRLADKPELFAQVTRGMCDLSKAGLELAKYREHVVETKRALAELASKRDQAGGLSPDTVARIEQELRLL